MYDKVKQFMDNFLCDWIDQGKPKRTEYAETMFNRPEDFQRSLKEAFEHSFLAHYDLGIEGQDYARYLFNQRLLEWEREQICFWEKEAHPIQDRLRLVLLKKPE